MKATTTNRTVQRLGTLSTVLAGSILALGLAACSKRGGDSLEPPDPGGPGGGGQVGGPGLEAVAPAAGPPAGGTLVEITGSGFAECASDSVLVLFGSELASDVVVLSDETLLATSPAGVAGETVQVTVVNGCGEATLPDAFTYAAGGSPPSDHDHDLDGDGLADLALGAPGSALGGEDAGAVFVLLGTPGPLAGQKHASQADVVILGGQPGDRFGAAVLTADLDGDGIADLVVGAPGASYAGEDAGAVYVFLGPLPAAALSAGDAQVTIPGSAAGARFGASLAVGSLDAAGERALLVGAPGASLLPGTPGELPGVGAVHLFRNTAALPSWLDASSASVTIDGVAAGDGLGAVLALADVTGDGVEELLLGAPEAGGQGGGAVYVLRDGPALVSSSVATAEATWLGAPGERLGAALAVGDLDGDGILDVVAGAPGSSALASGAGRAYLFLGAPLLEDADTSQAAAAFSGLQVDGRFGSALAIGDIDGDGYPELAIGAPRESHAAGGHQGRVYIFRGGPGAPADTVASSADTTYVGEVPSGGEFGSALGCVDMDGNGRPQMIVGAPRNDAAGADAGRVYVFRAQPGLVPHLPASAAMRITAASPGDLLGTSLTR